ncbi:hypothetical protein RZE82_07700 [Mollicutes bacterium LVI A0039]|nr:hypothetical protein RZE82_07700 [Mollicutes bacterium LVI A0039]
MKIFKGIVKKVPKDEHFEGHEKGIIEMSELKLIDTLITCQGESGEFEMLPIRLSYQEVDNNGNEKYIYDEQADAYIKTYRQTPILYARGKEMRILIELGEYSPVKVVASETTTDEHTFYRIECVQNQHCGLE